MIGHGAKLSGSSSGTIGKLTNVNWGGAVVEDVEITDFDSKERWREWESGMKDAGELTADLNYNKVLAATVYDAFGDEQTWTFTLNDNTSIILCAGYLKSLGLAVELGTQVKMPIGIRFTGVPHFPSSSSSSSSSSSA